MEPTFIIFQKFSQMALADNLISVLEANGIAYEVEDSSATFNVATLTSQGLTNEYCVKIEQGDFETVNTLLLKNEEQYVNAVDKDYYLFEFTDDELKDVLAHFDEWNQFDVVLARKILTDRGLAVSDAELQDIKDERIAELEQPEKDHGFWIILGYSCAILGGLFGVLIGRHFATQKKLLPNGEIIYAYSESDRKHGRRIFFIGMAVFIAVIAARIFWPGN